MSNVLNYFSQPSVGNDNILNLDGTWRINNEEVTANSSSLNKNYSMVSDNYIILDSDYFIEVTEQNKVLTLPSAVNIVNKTKNIDNSSNGTITINTTLSQTINGETSIILQPNENVTLVSNNTNWRIK